MELDFFLMPVDNLSGNATLLPLLRNFIYFYPLRLYLFLGICYANFRSKQNRWV